MLCRIDQKRLLRGDGFVMKLPAVCHTNSSVLQKRTPREWGTLAQLDRRRHECRCINFAGGRDARQFDGHVHGAVIVGVYKRVAVLLVACVVADKNGGIAIVGSR